MRFSEQRFPRSIHDLIISAFLKFFFSSIHHQALTLKNQTLQENWLKISLIHRHFELLQK